MEATVYYADGTVNRIPMRGFQVLPIIVYTACGQPRSCHLGYDFWWNERYYLDYQTVAGDGI